MTTYCVLVADRGRARFFTLEATPANDVKGGPNLIEHEDLTNPEKRMSQSTLFTESKPGSGRTAGNATVHGYDDHRNEHEAETDRKFARLVTKRGAEAAVERGCLHLIVASPSRMLGLIREHMDILNRHNVEVRMLAKDLTKLSVKQIHEHLAKEDYIPPRQRPPS